MWFTQKLEKVIWYLLAIRGRCDISKYLIIRPMSLLTFCMTFLTATLQRIPKIVRKIALVCVGIFKFVSMSSGKRRGQHSLYLVWCLTFSSTVAIRLSLRKTSCVKIYELSTTQVGSSSCARELFIKCREA